MDNSKIQLGSILSLTGEASQDARGIRDGIELAVKVMGRSGREVEVHFVDDDSDIVDSVRAIDTLTREYGVSIIIGPTWAPQVDAFAPIIDQERIVAFAPAVASDSIIRNSRYLLFGAERNTYKQSVLESFMKENSVRKVGVIISQDKWGVSHLLPIQNAASQAGAEVVFVEQIIPYISSFGRKYICDVVSRALRSEPDLIIWSGYEGEADVLKDFLLENGLSIPLIGDQLLVAGQRGEALRGYSGELFTFTNRFSMDFARLFEAEYDRGATLYSDIAYDATMLLADILSRNPDISSDDIMGLVKGEGYRYRGLSGTFEFDGQGDIRDGGRWIIERFDR